MKQKEFESLELAERSSFETIIDSLEMVALKVIIQIDFHTPEVEEVLWNR
ncbi:MAG: hypothetical protein ABS939_00210 [Psychrobacillus sp.]